ncbi:MAG: ABC transporter ATP-binding protein, partial [Deltaproteobacteria bacterium]
AHVGEILTVPFERPRVRHSLMDSSEFYELRERLVTFLENEQQHAPPPRVAVPKPRRGNFWDLLTSRA